jgi:F0F1-type ATP synthase membrane subunit c/vacuolar-type H+-ATPase subunit K
MPQIPARGEAGAMKLGDFVMVVDTPASALLAGLCGLLVSVAQRRATVMIVDAFTRQPIATVELPTAAVTVLEEDPRALGL